MGNIFNNCLNTIGSLQKYNGHLDLEEDDKNATIGSNRNLINSEENQEEKEKKSPILKRSQRFGNFQKSDENKEFTLEPIEKKKENVQFGKDIVIDIEPVVSEKKIKRELEEKEMENADPIDYPSFDQS